MYLEGIECVDLDTLISSKVTFYAHLKTAKKETLKEHTLLCEKYLKKIIESKSLDKVFENFEKIYLNYLSTEGKKLFRELLINIITLHDLGKINPLFQVKKMQNFITKDVEEFATVGSNHSIISAVLYVDYYIKKLKDLNKEDKSVIRLFIFLNAYIISKHHGNLNEFQIFLNEFDGGKVIDIFSNTYEEVYIKGFYLTEDKIEKECRLVRSYLKNKSEEEAIYLYTYERLLYSLLLACDFYATTEFMNGVEIKEFGEISEIDEFYSVYRDTEVQVAIKNYKNSGYNKKSKKLVGEKNINILRNEMFLDAENELDKKRNENIFFLEAPTGSGKSNVSMNLSFKLMENDPNLKKIFYVYPFNTLIEQNVKSLKKVFGTNEKIFNKITVINSISPIKMDEDKKKGIDNEDNYEYYAKALLNRQFLNYPMILTTHVSLFDMMFNFSKESSFGFHQLANSIIVLDEIQSYKNNIWTEIISFLNGFSKILNIKVVIMSATLPDLNFLTNKKDNTIHLIKDREKYFSNPLFKDRVNINYELMGKANVLDALYEHVKKNSLKKKKILIEFIKKKSAYDFFNALKEDEDIKCSIELMTGDDNGIERRRILNTILDKEVEEHGIILVATQVIEAGVDIDMDIGYKDISKLDSDEQFLGRINRSCKKTGIVYFFNLDRAENIYKGDVRVNNEFTLLEQDMKDILINKKFSDYYEPVLRLLKTNYNDSFSESNLEEFFKEKVGRLDSKAIKERMQLIDDNNWTMPIYLCRLLVTEEGLKINGEIVWEEYKRLLGNNSMNYSEKQVKLSEVKSNMTYFIYEIEKNNDFNYNDKIGEIYCIYDGDDYFDNGKINKEKFISQIGIFT